MRTSIVYSKDSSWVNEAMLILKQGGVVAFPTDTVYGIGAMLRNNEAVARLYEVKDRPTEKPIPVLISSTSMIGNFAETPSPDIQYLLQRFWPGPLTVILNAKPDLPPEVSRDMTVGVRIPDLDISLKLLQEAGPMAVTSANLSGHPSSTNAEDVYSQLEGRIDLLIDGGETTGGTPSTVIDCSSGSIEVLREGPISLTTILEALNEQ